MRSSTRMPTCPEASARKVNPVGEPGDERLRAELERLRRRVGLGFEVGVEWLPGEVRHRGGRRLLEEVVGDTILIYAEDEGEAIRLVRHGFIEWLLNRYTRNYRMLINRLIELFEQIQYMEKERVIEAMVRLIDES